MLISEAYIYYSQPGVPAMFHFDFLHRCGFFIKNREYFKAFKIYLSQLVLSAQANPVRRELSFSSSLLSGIE